MSTELPADPRVDEIIDIFVLEAAVDRSRLTADARPEDLGLSSLDLAMAMFEIEDHFKVQLPEIPVGVQFTLGDLIEQVLLHIDAQTLAQTPAAASAVACAAQ